MGFLDTVKALFTFGVDVPQRNGYRTIDDPAVVAARELAGGGLAPMPVTRLRWYPKDLETAQYLADVGDLSMAGQLYRAMRRDGTIAGLLSTRTAGLLRLPRMFSGEETMVEQLRSVENSQEQFDRVFPPSELERLAQDGAMLGVGLAELVDVPGRTLPIMIRHDPEFLVYRWQENRWYYRSIAGMLPIEPGDGRWILHLHGGRMSPWQFGSWLSCGDAFITKSHSKLYRNNYGSKLANPARVIQSPHGAAEPERVGMMAKLAAWGINSVFELPPGWEANLLESNGRGHDVWKEDIADADQQIKMSLAGQVVTSDGGTGFDKGDLFKMIRADLVQTDGDKLAETLNTQALPQLTARVVGEGAAIASPASVMWDTTPPQDRQREATMLQSAASAVKSLSEAVKPLGFEVATEEIARKLGLPVRKAQAAAAPSTKIEIAPTDMVKSLRVREVRASRDFPPLGDDRDEMLYPELEQMLAAAKAAQTPEGEAVADAPEAVDDEPIGEVDASDT